MTFHHFAVEMSRIVVQNIQYFGATSNIRVENSLAGPAGGREHMRLPGSKKPREGTPRVPSRGLCSKWDAQNATFMNSATQHRITASGT